MPVMDFFPYSFTGNNIPVKMIRTLNRHLYADYIIRSLALRLESASCRISLAVEDLHPLGFPS